MKVGSYFGFDLLLEKNPQTLTFFEQGAPCVISLCGALKYTTEVSLDNKVGNTRRIENLAQNEINKRIQNLSADIDKAKSDLEEARKGMGKQFDRAEELAQKLARLDVVNRALSENNGKSPSAEEAADKPNFKPKKVRR